MFIYIVTIKIFYITVENYVSIIRKITLFERRKLHLISRQDTVPLVEVGKLSSLMLDTFMLCSHKNAEKYSITAGLLHLNELAKIAALSQHKMP